MNPERTGSTAPEPDWQQGEKQKGEMEPFNAEDIKNAIQGAGVPPEDAREIAEEVGRSARSDMTREEIDSRIRTLLRLRNPEWERIWINSRPESRRLWMPKMGDVKTLEDLEPRI